MTLIYPNVILAWLVILAVGWLIGAFLAMEVAFVKHRSGLGWFMAAIVASPLIALIALAGVPVKLPAGEPSERELLSDILDALREAQPDTPMDRLTRRRRPRD